MPARAPTQRKTWLDWMPEDAPEPELHTRDEIAEMASGIDLTHPCELF